MSEQFCPVLKAIHKLVPPSSSNSMYSQQALSTSQPSRDHSHLCHFVQVPGTFCSFPSTSLSSSRLNSGSSTGKGFPPGPLQGDFLDSPSPCGSLGSPSSTWQLRPIVYFMAHSLISPGNWCLPPGGTCIFHFSGSVALCLSVQWVLL